MSGTKSSVEWKNSRCPVKIFLKTIHEIKAFSDGINWDCHLKSLSKENSKRCTADSGRWYHIERLKSKKEWTAKLSKYVNKLGKR